MGKSIAPASPPGCAWYRLHGATWVAPALAIVVTATIMVRGGSAGIQSDGRDWHTTTAYSFTDGRCRSCGALRLDGWAISGGNQLRVVDVVLTTKEGHNIRTRCVAQPNDHQKILLERLSRELPGRLTKIDL